MRLVDRTQTARPNSLAPQNSPGATELQNARAHYTGGAQGTFKFRAYKGDDVKLAIRTLFSGKCTYCESDYASTQPPDIEHYRPKSGIEEDKDHRGYWWMAMKWENLLPSCIDCNRRRRQAIWEEGKSLEDLENDLLSGNTANSGKQNSFPTANDWWAQNENQNVDDEDPLLIDPTSSNPKDFIEWHFEENLSVLLPKHTETGLSRHGEATIHILGLNRLDLIKARTKRLMLIEFACDYAESRIEEIERSEPGVAAEEAKERALSAIQKVRSFIGLDSPYSAMAEDWIMKYRPSIFKLLNS